MLSFISSVLDMTDRQSYQLLHQAYGIIGKIKLLAGEGRLLLLYLTALPLSPAHSCSLFLFLLPVLFPDSEWNLLVITQARQIGRLPPSGGMVYCIEKVSMISLSVEKTIDEIRMEVIVLPPVRFI